MVNSKKEPNYILFYMGLFTIFGVLYNKLSLGLILGFTIGFIVDAVKKKRFFRNKNKPL